MAKDGAMKSSIKYHFITLIFSGDKNPMFGKRGIDSPMYNRKWINNGQQEKFVNLRDNELPQGYSLGRLKHK